MKRLATLIAASLLAGSAIAGDRSESAVAQLSGIEGSVLVNQGEKFVTAEDGQALLAGDRVLVLEGAQATVKFNDGCDLSVESGSSLVVPSKSTCAGAVAQTARVNPQLAQAVGDVSATQGATTATIKWVPLIVGGVTAGFIAIEVTDNRDVVVSP